MRRLVLVLLIVSALVGAGLILSRADATAPVKNATFTTTFVSTYATADSFGIARATLTCPTGTKPTGGWWDFDSLNGTVTTNIPRENNQWQIIATQLDVGNQVILGPICGSLTTS